MNPFTDKDRHNRFKRADQSFRTKKYKEAAETFEKLYKDSPRFATLAIRAAEAHAKAGDKATAKHLIVKAISSGWTSATWLSENESLSPLMKERPLSALAGRLSSAPIALQGPMGFSSQAAWTASGHRGESLDQGMPFMLSCMLGVVDPRGSTIKQAIDVLKVAATGDRTNPDAAFWFTVTNDVRTKTRVVASLDAKEWLTYLNRKNVSKIKANPKDRGTLAGLMLSTPKITLAKRKWRFVPGAIADNLTSHGGNYTSANQTKMTALLHYGAAMTSGTVTEPYAIQAKFPLPIMYGYYASGVTAIEAFYLSVASPYQLLIAGDPLAQPFSQPPGDMITMGEVETGQDVTTIQFSQQKSPGQSRQQQAGVFEIYMNGRIAKRVPPIENLKLNLPENLKGSVEFRIVLIGRSAIQPRASHIHWVDLGDPTKIPKATANNQTSSVSVQCAGADSIELMHHRESMGSVSGASGKISINSRKWGGGPVRVRPVAKFGDQRIAGRPVIIELPVVVKAAP